MRKIHHYVAGLTLLAAMNITPAYATQIILNATQNVVVEDGTGTATTGLLGSELNTTGLGSVWLSLLKFDLSTITGVTVNSATFELTTSFNHHLNSFAHNVYSSSDDSWSEATTGLNRPSNATLSLLDSTNIDGSSKAYTWNVLAGVTGSDGLAGSNALLSLLVRPDLIATTDAFGPHFYTRSDTFGAPRLILDVNNNQVPVPSTCLLLAAGLLGLQIKRRAGHRLLDQAAA